MLDKTKVLSILTPVLATSGTRKLLTQTISSITSQSLPQGWRYEWIVVEDGAQPTLKDYDWPDTVRYFSVKKQVGEPAARTLALSMAQGEYVLAFDADDTLPPDALKKICMAFENNPCAVWVAGQEATPRHHKPYINHKDSTDYLPEGLTSPNKLYNFWRRTGQYPVTFQCAYKAEVLWQVGGYPAMPFAGDINLLFAISTIYSGVLLYDVLLNYRRWSGQMTAQKEYFAAEQLSYQHAKKWVAALQGPKR